MGLSVSRKRVLFHDYPRNRNGAQRSRVNVTELVHDYFRAFGYGTFMVPRQRRRPSARLYIKEWLTHRGLSVEAAADRLGIARQSLNRWINEQHRLTPVKIAELAVILDCDVTELWRQPGTISLDAIVAGQDDEVRQMAANIVRQLVARPRK